MRFSPGPAFHRRVSLNRKHVIELRNVSCTRNETGIPSSAHEISVGLDAGSVTLFAGERGCGKNLILRLLGLLETPDRGEVIIGGSRISAMPKERVLDLRDTACGYVFSPPFLLPGFTVMENIAMPLFKIFDMPPIEAQERTELLIEFVQLTKFITEKIDYLSLGLQLRVGLARALGSHPPLLIVEEPDLILGGAEMEAFRRLLLRAAQDFACAVAVSVGAEIAAMPGERRIECVNGRIVCDVLP